MKSIVKSIILLSAAVLLASCSDKLLGTWTIQKYETTTPGEQGVTLSNIGTMTFEKNGHGMKNISYTIFNETKNDKTPFTWEASEKFITIDSEGSEFAKTWIVIEKKKDFILLKSTDGANQVQILELKK